MTASLTTLIARAQALLLDSGTVFSTATLTAAFRDALSRWNAVAPLGAAALVDAVADQYEYELDTGDNPLALYGVWLQDPAGGERDEPLKFHAYNEDNRIFFRLAEPRAAGETLIARYAIPHTINGLDSETESTLTAAQDDVLINGACAVAINTRLSSRVETINLAPNVVQNYERAGEFYLKAFEAGLALYNRPVGQGQPSTAAWNDAYHTFWPAGWDSQNG